MNHPPLQLDQLNMQLGKLALIDRTLQLPGVACSTDRLGVSGRFPFFASVIGHLPQPIAKPPPVGPRKNEPETPWWAFIGPPRWFSGFSIARWHLQMCGCSPRVMRKPVKEANRFDMTNGVICSQRAGRDRIERCAAM